MTSKFALPTEDIVTQRKTPQRKYKNNFIFAEVLCILFELHLGQFPILFTLFKS